jgi:hypothetical protein
VDADQQNALNRLMGLGGPRSQAEQQQMAYEVEKYRLWPEWAVELDRKLNEVLRMLDGR